jgi:hypothetical protein
VRIGRIFELDASWKDKPPSQIKRLRAEFLRPHVDLFFGWVEQQRAIFRGQRGLSLIAQIDGALVTLFDGPAPGAA